MHSWSHRALTTLTNEEIIAEFEYTAIAIEKVINARPKYYRPPFGDYDDRVRAVLKSMGLIPVLWNYDTFDYEYAGTDAQKQKVLNSVTNQVNQFKNMNHGVISLSHDIAALPTQLLKDYITTIINSGAKLMTVGQCVGDHNPYLTGNQQQPPPAPPAPQPNPPVEPPTAPIITSTAYSTETATVSWPVLPPGNTFTAIPPIQPPSSANKVTAVFVGFWIAVSFILTNIL